VLALPPLFVKTDNAVLGVTDVAELWLAATAQQGNDARPTGRGTFLVKVDVRATTSPELAWLESAALTLMMVLVV
jgi:hypothetical protein